MAKLAKNCLKSHACFSVRCYLSKEEISVKFMRWKTFEGPFSGFFFPFQELLSAERRTHLLFLSILKEVNWFPVRFSTVINGSLFFKAHGVKNILPFLFLPNIFLLEVQVQFPEFWIFCHVLIFESRRQSQKNQLISDNELWSII